MAPLMRSEDVLEAYAASGHGPLQALDTGLELSDPCFTAWEGGVPLAIFGTVPTVIGGRRFGTVWLLGTDRIRELPIPFLHQSKSWLARISQGCDMVGNVMDARNKVHERWLWWLGFHFVCLHKEYGHLRLPFKEFVKSV